MHESTQELAAVIQHEQLTGATLTMGALINIDKAHNNIQEVIQIMKHNLSN